MKIVMLCLSIMIWTNLQAGGLDPIIPRARKAKSKEIIQCSPDGKDGLLPKEAVAKLKDGMTLVVMSGDYSMKNINITQKNIIITGSGPGFCQALVNITGKGCIVKDIHLRRLLVTESVVITDAFIQMFTCSRDIKEKMIINHVIYNSAFQHLNLKTNGILKTSMRNCTVKDYIEADSNLTLNIEDSILFTIQNSTIFKLRQKGKKKGKLTLKNNLISHKDAYLATVGFRVKDSSKTEEFKDLKTFAKFWGLTFSKNITNEEPIFLLNRKPDFYSNPIEYYILKTGSTGTSKGIIPKELKFYQDRQEKVRQLEY